MKAIVAAISWLFILSARADTLVCIGDSVTLGSQVGDSNYCQRLGGINAGVGGDTTVQGLERFRRDVLVHNPRTITIGFGLNDPSNGISVKQFRANMLAMIRLANPKRRKVVLLTPNPRPVGYFGETKEQLNGKLYPYVLEIRRIARQQKLQVVDVYAKFAELGLRDDMLKYFADIIHPNAAGHDVIYKLFVRAGI
jgi:lysophospholipase L1-like esterase